MPEAAVKISQYCSVCKQELEMEVVPTGDGEDDGVIWLRCPSCQGFLPKISSSLDKLSRRDSSETTTAGADGTDAPAVVDQDLSADAADVDAVAEPDADAEEETAGGADSPAEAAAPREPVAEYAAMLARADVSTATPYRPWETYAVGDVLHHLAWDDCGVVVAKESLPGGRSVVKAYFEGAGVVRLIENAPGKP